MVFLPCFPHIFAWMNLFFNGGVGVFPVGWMYSRGVNLYGLRVSLTDVCDLHGLTGVRCNLYGYL